MTKFDYPICTKQLFLGITLLQHEHLQTFWSLVKVQLTQV